jgi:tetratricopeptide (TPR) repeat protein
VEKFIPQYRTALERSYRDSAYSFNMARLKFARKAYDEALELLQHSNYHEPLLNMAAKTMSLKIYYALGEFDVLAAHLEAFIKYIRRKPGLGYHRNNYLLLAQLTQKLISLNRNDKAEVQALRQRIESEPVLTEREWLLEQF